jgi:hypothetical protein
MNFRLVLTAFALLAACSGEAPRPSGGPMPNANGGPSSGTGASGGSSSGSSSSSSGSTAGGPQRPGLMFVSAGELPGNMSIAAADGLCNAEGQRLRAGSTFTAFLHDGPTRPESRIGRGPWHLVGNDVDAAGGPLVFSSPADTLLSPRAPIPAPVAGSQYAWVGQASQDCSRWQDRQGEGLTGEPGSNELQLWRNSGTRSCEDAHHVYCFEVF